jgi:hypothetical protein
VWYRSCYNIISIALLGPAETFQGSRPDLSAKRISTGWLAARLQSGALLQSAMLAQPSPAMCVREDSSKQPGPHQSLLRSLTVPQSPQDPSLSCCCRVHQNHHVALLCESWGAMCVCEY